MMNMRIGVQIVRMVLGPLAAAACGGGGGHTDIKPTLRLADRTDAELSRLISAAGGTDMFSAEAQVNQFASPITPDPCPGIAIAGNTVTLTGGCTTTNMLQIDGSATLTNPSGWDQITFSPTADQVYDFTQLTLTQAGFATRYDGTFRITDTFTTWDANLTTTVLAVPLRSDIYYHCDQSSSTCELSGSGVELIGVGGVTADGSVSLANNSETATYHLYGLDTLTATVVQGCVAWQIAGTARQKTCP